MSTQDDFNDFDEVDDGIIPSTASPSSNVIKYTMGELIDIQIQVSQQIQNKTLSDNLALLNETIKEKARIYFRKPQTTPSHSARSQRAGKGGGGGGGIRDIKKFDFEAFKRQEDQKHIGERFSGPSKDNRPDFYTNTTLDFFGLDKVGDDNFVSLDDVNILDKIKKMNIEEDDDDSIDPFTSENSTKGTNSKTAKDDNDGFDEVEESDSNIDVDDAFKDDVRGSNDVTDFQKMLFSQNGMPFNPPPMPESCIDPNNPNNVVNDTAFSNELFSQIQQASIEQRNSANSLNSQNLLNSANAFSSANSTSSFMTPVPTPLVTTTPSTTTTPATYNSANSQNLLPNLFNTNIQHTQQQQQQNILNPNIFPMAQTQQQQLPPSHVMTSSQFPANSAAFPPFTSSSTTTTSFIPISANAVPPSKKQASQNLAIMQQQQMIALQQRQMQLKNRQRQQQMLQHGNDVSAGSNEGSRNLRKLYGLDVGDVTEGGGGGGSGADVTNSGNVVNVTVNHKGNNNGNNNNNVNGMNQLQMLQKQQMAIMRQQQQLMQRQKQGHQSHQGGVKIERGGRNGGAKKMGQMTSSGIMTSHQPSSASASSSSSTVMQGQQQGYLGGNQFPPLK